MSDSISLNSRLNSGLRKRVSLSLVVVLTLFTLTACAQRDGESADDPPAAGFPVTVQPERAPAVTVDARPERIVSLSPSATETLYAVDAGKQVVAVDSSSTFPENAPRGELSGINVAPEAIAAKNPDLVVVSSDLDGKLTSALNQTGITTLVLPDALTLDAAYRQFELVGEATGHPAEGKVLAQDTRAAVDAAVASAPKRANPLRYYHELDPSFYSTTSATFIGELYKKFALVNIADGDDPKASGGYPQLSAERILQANPDLVFLADTKCCGQNAQTVAARPGWSTLSAVQQNGVVALDDDIASRWSPRVADLAKAVAAALNQQGR